jgi:hypothetical protein
MELIDMLTSGLGVKEDEAKGGTGLLMNLAKEKLGAGDFGKIANVIPGVDDLIKTAPEADTGIMGTLGKMASGMGGSMGQLGTLASLAGGFSKLGLDADMIGKFVPIILSFVQQKGGKDIGDLLAKAFK